MHQGAHINHESTDVFRYHMVWYNTVNIGAGSESCLQQVIAIKMFITIYQWKD